MNDNTERFLERATAGLATDPELRLDVQAELRSHIEDKTAELGGEEHADEAVASLGEVVELAEEVSEANQRRLGWRNLARRILRFGLVPVAVICAVLFSDISGIVGNEWSGADSNERKVLALLYRFCLPAPFARFADDWENPEPQWFRFSFLRWLDQRPPLTDYQRLLFHGDSSQEYSERRRTLWERNPANRAYYADYINSTVRYGPRTLARLEPAARVDPDNGRYPLLAALCKATTAAELSEEKRADAPTIYRLVPKDRAALDGAMDDLLAAAGKPHFRAYVTDMLREKVEALGPPQCVTDAMEGIRQIFGIPVPNINVVYDAGRYSLAYAQLLIGEGREEDAVPFLGVSETLGRKLVPESFSLLDMIIVRIVMEHALRIVPEALRGMGRPGEAAVAEERLTALVGPMRRARKARLAGRSREHQMVSQRGDRMLGATFSFTDGQETDERLARLTTARRLRSTSLARAGVSLLALWLVVAMLVCLALSLRWRLALGAQAAPLLLLPSWRDMVRFVLLGVVLPLAVFEVWTRWVPLSGHAFSLGYAGYRSAVEFLVLGATLALLPAWLALRAFRQRCGALDLPSPPTPPKVLYVPLVLGGVLLAVAFAIPPSMKSAVQKGMTFANWGALMLALFFLLVLVHAVRTSRAQGRTIGTLCRSLIPVFAAAILLLSVVVQPLLHAEERQLLRARRGWLDSELGVSTAVLKHVQRLRDETLKVMAENPMPAKPKTKAQP